MGMGWSFHGMTTSSQRETISRWMRGAGAAFGLTGATLAWAPLKTRLEIPV